MQTIEYKPRNSFHVEHYEQLATDLFIYNFKNFFSHNCVICELSNKDFSYYDVLVYNKVLNIYSIIEIKCRSYTSDKFSSMHIQKYKFDKLMNAVNNLGFNAYLFTFWSDNKLWIQPIQGVTDSDYTVRYPSDYEKKRYKNNDEIVNLFFNNSKDILLSYNNLN